MALGIGLRFFAGLSVLVTTSLYADDAQAKSSYQIKAIPTEENSENWLNGVQYVDSSMPNSIVRIVSIRDSLPDKQSTFRVYIKNKSQNPISFGPDNIRISFPDGKQISMVPYEELEGRLRRDIKRRNFLAAMGGALSAGGANGYTSGTFSYSGMTNSGTLYNGSGMYSGHDPALAQQQQQAFQRQQNATSAAIRTREASGASALAGLIRKSTVEPGQGFGGVVAYEIPASIKNPMESPVRIIVQVGSEEHKFLANIYSNQK